MQQQAGIVARFRQQAAEPGHGVAARQRVDGPVGQDEPPRAPVRLQGRDQGGEGRIVFAGNQINRDAEIAEHGKHVGVALPGEAALAVEGFDHRRRDLAAANLRLVGLAPGGGRGEIAEDKHRGNIALLVVEDGL